MTSLFTNLPVDASGIPEHGDGVSEVAVGLTGGNREGDGSWRIQVKPATYVGLHEEHEKRE